jgi:hypothetical protein
MRAQYGNEQNGYERQQEGPRDEGQTAREHAVESADGQQRDGRRPPGEAHLTSPGAVSVILLLFYGSASSDPQAHAGVRHR